MSLPLLRGKFNLEGTTKPLDIFLRSNNVKELSELRKAPKNCIVSPSSKIIGFLDRKPDEGPRIITPINFVNDDLAIYTGFIGFGSPMWVWAFEQLIAYGIKNFIFLGYLGLINPEFDKDQFLIPTKAFRDEGTSYHYAKAAKWAYPDKDLSEKLLTFPNTKKSGIWTTDAMFRQTENEIQEACKLGIAGFDMECSALFTVGTTRKCNVASIQLVSDAYVGGKYVNYYKAPDFDKKVERAFRMATEVLKSDLQ